MSALVRFLEPGRKRPKQSSALWLWFIAVVLAVLLILGVWLR